MIMKRFVYMLLTIGSALDQRWSANTIALVPRWWLFEEFRVETVKKPFVKKMTGSDLAKRAAVKLTNVTKPDKPDPKCKRYFWKRFRFCQGANRTHYQNLSLIL